MAVRAACSDTARPAAACRGSSRSPCQAATAAAAAGQPQPRMQQQLQPQLPCLRLQLKEIPGRACLDILLKVLWGDGGRGLRLALLGVGIVHTLAIHRRLQPSQPWSAGPLPCQARLPWLALRLDICVALAVICHPSHSQHASAEQRRCCLRLALLGVDVVRALAVHRRLQLSQPACQRSRGSAGCGLLRLASAGQRDPCTGPCIAVCSPAQPKSVGCMQETTWTLVQRCLWPPASSHRGVQLLPCAPAPVRVGQAGLGGGGAEMHKMHKQHSRHMQCCLWVRPCWRLVVSPGGPRLRC